jgi:hypothetical protein
VSSSGILLSHDSLYFSRRRREGKPLHCFFRPYLALRHNQANFCNEISRFYSTFLTSSYKSAHVVVRFISIKATYSSLTLKYMSIQLMKTKVARRYFRPSMLFENSPTLLPTVKQDKLILKATRSFSIR